VNTISLFAGEARLGVGIIRPLFSAILISSVG
jgi:hypothetical protein